MRFLFVTDPEYRYGKSGIPRTTIIIQWPDGGKSTLKLEGEAAKIFADYGQKGNFLEFSRPEDNFPF